MIYPYDYYYLWSAGRVVLQGANVYDPLVLRETMLSIGWPPELEVWGFTHPPWTLWLYLPYALLPFHVASFFWILTQVLLLLGIAKSIVRVCNEYLSEYRSLSFYQVAFALFLFPPVIKVLAYGQSSVLLLFGFTFFIESYLRGRMRSAGLFLSLTLLKPHHLIPLFLLLGFRELREKRLEMISWACVGFAIQIALGFCFYPQGFSLFFEFVPKLYSSSGVLPGAALAQILEANLSFTLARPVLFALVCALGLFYEIHFRPNFLQFILVMSTLSLLATPYAFLHAYVLLAFPFTILSQDLFQSYGERVYLGILVCLALCGIGVVSFISYEYLVVLLPIVLSILVLMRVMKKGHLKIA